MMTVTDHLDELLFCETMVNHYAEQYKKRMHGWHFKKAAFAWKRLQFYKNILWETRLQLQSLLTEINQQHGIAITAS